MEQLRNNVLVRGGVLLVVAGLIDGAVTIARSHVAGFWPGIADLAAIVGGGWLLVGSPRAAFWVRTIAVLLLAAGVVGLIGALFLQPFDLTVAEVRLDPTVFETTITPLLLWLCVLGWIVRELQRPSVLNATAGSASPRWTMRLLAQVGASVSAVAAVLFWFALHGQSAELATSLAEQQLGPEYRYHMSWISSSDNGHGSSVSSTVIAWNDKEIRRVLLHWEKR